MAEIYDTDRFRQLYNGSRKPTSNHLFLAASHFAQICQGFNIPYAFMGGWTVRLRGGTRETQDVDITVATTMELLKQALLRMPRYVLACDFWQKNGLHESTVINQSDVHRETHFLV